jgi:hypothetical protein
VIRTVVAVVNERTSWKDTLMAKRKAPAPAASAKTTPVKGRPTKAEAKAAFAARQPDLLDILTEKPKATRTRAKRDKPDLNG